MKADARRQAILTQLAQAAEPVSASALAAGLGVSRQIVVGDVALLRAAGAQIDATPRGYRLAGAGGRLYTGLVACAHSTAAQMRQELYIIVDNGGVAEDVIVENPLYGELRGNLNLSSRYEVDAFVAQAEQTPVSLLSSMTGGVHLHTVRCASEAAFRRIEAALAAAGLLYRRE